MSDGLKPFQRRTDTEKRQIGDYFSGSRRYYDQNAEVTVVKVHSGEYYVNEGPGEMLVTILGSCVAACVRDPKLGIGGMNHFLLPEYTASKPADADESTRYGAYAMERLINEILKHGASRGNLEAKLFGGGNVIASSAMIGDKNALFARKFLKDEGIKLVASDLGDSCPRRVHYYPDTGRAMVRRLQRREDMRILDEEKQYEDALLKRPATGKIELFS